MTWFLGDGPATPDRLELQVIKQTHHPIPASDAISVVQFLIERQDLTQRELTSEFGSESAVSMFLAGQRKLTLEQVRKLSSRFKLPADVFIRSL